MIIPGAPDTIEAGARHLLSVLENFEARRNPRHRTKLWEDLSEDSRAMLMRAVAPAQEIAIVALLTHQREIIGGYDGCMGGSYERALIRYSHQELNYDPATGQQITRGYR